GVAREDLAVDRNQLEVGIRPQADRRSAGQPTRSSSKRMPGIDSSGTGISFCSPHEGHSRSSSSSNHLSWSIVPMPRELTGKDAGGADKAGLDCETGHPNP